VIRFAPKEQGLQDSKPADKIGELLKSFQRKKER
jgi:hypothetical protein